MLYRFAFLCMFAAHVYSTPLFHAVYPFVSFKSVVDTCMRSYTDVLIMQDKIYLHERIDEQMDLLVGRLMRLKSYIEQAIIAYRFEATVTYDELEYVMRMLDYLEVTISEQGYHEVSASLNKIIFELKKQLKSALDIQEVAWMWQPTWSPVRFAFIYCAPRIMV